jgi:hypothetical protein
MVPKITQDHYFEIAEAIHCFASLNHSGQWSELYAVLCQSEFSPGVLWSETRCLADNEYVNELTEETCIQLSNELCEYLGNRI